MLVAGPRFLAARCFLVFALPVIETGLAFPAPIECRYCSVYGKHSQKLANLYQDIQFDPEQYAPNHRVFLCNVSVSSEGNSQ